VTLRCAIYARYSSDMQSENSIDDQIRVCRARAEREGWQVVEASTVRQGLVEAGTRRPDLIIADLGLPDGDGIELGLTLDELSESMELPTEVLAARLAGLGLEAGKGATLTFD